MGYDIDHSQVERLLLKAAKESGLEEPFVHILELGSFSVTYRVSGLLTDVKWLISARSELFRSVLDTFHGEGIEIMSPTFMNQRQIGEDQKIVPIAKQVTTSEERVAAEEVVFDKAEKAEKTDSEKKKTAQEIEELEASLKEASEEEKKRIKEEIETKKERLEALAEEEGEPTSEDDPDEQADADDAQESRG